MQEGWLKTRSRQCVLGWPVMQNPAAVIVEARSRRVSADTLTPLTKVVHLWRYPRPSPPLKGEGRVRGTLSPLFLHLKLLVALFRPGNTGQVGGLGRGVFPHALQVDVFDADLGEFKQEPGSVIVG